MENISAPRLAELRVFSRRLFGREHRLEVALAILDVSDEEPHNLYKETLAKTLGVTDTEVEKHLRAFRAIGLLEDHPDPPDPPEKRGRGRPPTIVRPTGDGFWRCLEELGDRFQQTPPPRR
jgi:predicted ArsR family transcriptional regulator